ncbi:MAG: serine dehydratase [Ramlibacter sp.]|nr:serine dehydratase [Ramlibacter sp.]
MTSVQASLSAAGSAALKTRTPLLWLNPDRAQVLAQGEDSDFAAAQARFARAGALLGALFPELNGTDAPIESPLLPVPRLQESMGLPGGSGKLFVKADHLLPIAGSIKARGGFHEVLAHAEALAITAGVAEPGVDLSVLSSPKARALFSSRTIAVGSTGNLGLSIGVLAAALGFRAVVHMSSDAKSWKKDELRRRGAVVVEHAGDYAQAVAAGRAQSRDDANSYFVDDENSLLLLAGYAAAARPLAAQLAAAGRTPSAKQPLFVYLPCGVGGAPGGIALGLARLFGSNVHCFFAEPVASPCMLLRMATDPGQDVSVYDWGLDNRTVADGLAVPRASALVASRIANVLSGVFTVTDEQLFSGLLRAWECERLEIEPSAAAGFPGPHWIVSSEVGRRYIEAFSLEAQLENATHLLWTTGGSLLPQESRRRLREEARLMEAPLKRHG